MTRCDSHERLLKFRVGPDDTSLRMCVAVAIFAVALLCFGLAEDYSAAFQGGTILSLIGLVVTGYALSVPRNSGEPRVPWHPWRCVPFLIFGGIFLYFLMVGDNITDADRGPVILFVLSDVFACWRAWARVGQPHEETRRQLFAACKLACMLSLFRLRTIMLSRF
jgi:hypothetical protein